MNPGFASFLLRARATGPAAANVLRAIEAVDRTRYVPRHERARAFTDHIIPLPCGQAMDRLDDLIPLLAAAGIEPSHRVLEIGTGSGFLTAVLAGLADQVVTTDRYRTLLADARKLHAEGDIRNVQYVQRDGTNPDAAEGVFDRIVSTVAFEEFPKGFIARLSPAGAAVVPIGSPLGMQTLTRFGKVGARFERHEVGTGTFPAAERGVALAL